MKAYYYWCEEFDKVETMVLMCEASYSNEIIEKKLSKHTGILFAESDFYDVLEKMIPLLIQDVGCKMTFVASYGESEVSKKALELACLYSMSCIHLCDLLVECVLHQDDRLLEDVRMSFEGVDRESMQSAKMYVECGMSVNHASSKLYIHRNTMNYRLNKFMKQTDLDIHDFHDALYFYFVCKLL